MEKRERANALEIDSLLVIMVSGADNHSLRIKRQSQSPYPKVEKAYLDPWLKVSGGGSIS